MVMMYATNCMLKGWWDSVTVIVWGATAKYAATDEGIQEYIKIAQHAGVKFSACISCANKLGVTGELEALGLEVIPWGPPLTDILQNGEPLITI